MISLFFSLLQLALWLLATVCVLYVAFCVLCLAALPFVMCFGWLASLGTKNPVQKQHAESVDPLTGCE